MKMTETYLCILMMLAMVSVHAICWSYWMR